MKQLLAGVYAINLPKGGDRRGDIQKHHMRINHTKEIPNSMRDKL